MTLTETQRALLGDREAAKRVTEAGELLPCPMCKSEEISVQVDGYNVYDPETLGYVDSVDDEFIYVACENCGLTTESIYLEDEEFEDAVKKIAVKWNTRAPLLTPTQLALLEISREPRKMEVDISVDDT